METLSAGSTAAGHCAVSALRRMLGVLAIAAMCLLVSAHAASAASLVGSSPVSYVSASNTCAAQSPAQRLCTADELRSAAAAGLSASSAVWVLASVGDTGALSGTLSGGAFTAGGSREDFTSASHLTACCDFGNLGVSNLFATDLVAQIDGCPSGYDTSTDLNRGAKGKFIFMCTHYSRADSLASNSQLLADLTVVAGSKSSVSCPSGYTKLSQDLNQGAKGKFIYFCALYSSTDSRAIADAYVTQGDQPCLGGYEFINQDLNAGAGGDFLYLCFKRTNRQLKYLADPTGDPARVAQFSPGFHLSKRERFFPVSVPTLLASAASAIYAHDGARSSDGAFVFPLASISDPSPCTAAAAAAGDCTPIHSQDAFAQFASVDQSYCFGFSTSNGAEEHTDWYSSDRTDARVYYAVQRAPSGADENVLLTFVLLYRWNGCVHYLDCQPSARLCSAGALYPHVQHMGDIERLSVLVDRTLTRVIGVEVEKHGIAIGYPMLDYPAGYTGTRGASGPHVYVAAETHGMYPTSDTSNPGPNGWTQECHACSGCSHCECYDPIWTAGTDQLVRVGRKTEYPQAADGGNWVDGEYWQRFPGRFGCGGSITSAEPTGVATFSQRWYVTSASYPTSWQPPVTGTKDWHSPA